MAKQKTLKQVVVNQKIVKKCLMIVDSLLLKIKKKLSEHPILRTILKIILLMRAYLSSLLGVFHVTVLYSDAFDAVMDNLLQKASTDPSLKFSKILRHGILSIKNFLTSKAMFYVISKI